MFEKMPICSKLQPTLPWRKRYNHSMENRSQVLSVTRFSQTSHLIFLTLFQIWQN